MYKKDGTLDCEKIRNLYLKIDGIESCEYAPVLPFPISNQKMMGFVFRKGGKRYGCAFFTECTENTRENFTMEIKTEIEDSQKKF